MCFQLNFIYFCEVIMNYKNIFTSLFFTLFLGCARPASAMEERKKVPEEQRMQLYSNSFFNACAKGDVGVVICLLGRGFNANTKNEREIMPLHIACKHGHVDIIEVLIENGADINTTIGGLFTPLHCAVFAHHAIVVRYLLNSGANLEAQTIYGHTALQIARDMRDEVIIELFPDESGEDASAIADFADSDFKQLKPIDEDKHTVYKNGRKKKTYDAL